MGSAALKPGRGTLSELDATRRRYAEELGGRLALRSKRLVEALATVAREDFVGPGPWLTLRAPEGYVSTPNRDPACLYVDIPIALDPGRLLNNGAPSLVAALIDALEVEEGQRVVHIGAGTGYYSAILGEMVGRSGRVTAIELDRGFAARARQHLVPWPQVTLVAGDGTRHAAEPADAILVSAGCTHPKSLWIDGLLPGGRLVIPLTGFRAPPPAARFGRNLAGQALLVHRQGDRFAARFLIGIGISFCHGARDLIHERLLVDSFRAGGASEVRSLVRFAHPRDGKCWFHAPEFCLSRREPHT
ncbi:MAG TPA: rRNA adenine N-6-methyltransferase family protein [Myxococcota bacterium]|nr:rRNA adenine N-6-methyltransferase family protein [Myxococcota bacterium]